MRVVRICADDRERPSGVIEALAATPGVSVEFAHLESGDYQVDERLVFERKTAADFAASLLDGRLFRQASRLAFGRLRPAYILQGTGREWNALGVSREALQGALVTLMLIFDIPVLRAADPTEAARLLVYAARQRARLADPSFVAYPQAKGKKTRTRQLRLLQQLPGVGPERARRLLEHFGSVRGCLNAGLADLQLVSGVGPGVAAKIVQTVQERSFSSVESNAEVYW